MKNTKRRLEALSFYDHTGIEKHLKKMAEQGWMLEKITPFGWVYRRTEPKTGQFAVTYYANASEFDPGPTEGQQIYQDYTARTGWVFLCSSAQMQVFYTEQEDPILIETDPVLQVENIHRAAQKGFLPAYILLFFASALNLLLFVSRLLGHPISLLASPTDLFTGLCWTMLTILCVVELLGYWRWMERAEEAAERGEFLDTPNTSRLQQVILGAVLLVLLYWVVNIVLTGPVMLRWISILAVAYPLTVILAVNGVKQFLKKKKVPKGVNLAITLTVDIVLAVAMMGLLVHGTLWASEKGLFDPDAQTYEHRGNTLILHQDEIPLAIEDLTDIKYDGYIRERSEDESIFLGLLDVYQWPRLDDDDRTEVPDLEYTVTIVKMPFLYDLCKNKLLEKYQRSGTVRFPQGYAYEPVDPAPWGAEEAYQLTYKQPLDWYKYLLCYKDRLVEIILDWEPTAEQMAVVREKLTAAT